MSEWLNIQVDTQPEKLTITIEGKGLQEIGENDKSREEFLRLIDRKITEEIRKIRNYWFNLELKQHQKAREQREKEAQENA